MGYTESWLKFLELLLFYLEFFCDLSHHGEQKKMALAKFDRRASANKRDSVLSPYLVC